MRIKQRRSIQEHKGILEQQRQQQGAIAASAVGDHHSATGGFTRRPDEVAANQRRGWVTPTTPWPVVDPSSSSSGRNGGDERQALPYEGWVSIDNDGGNNGGFPSETIEVLQIGKSQRDEREASASARASAEARRFPAPARSKPGMSLDDVGVWSDGAAQRQGDAWHSVGGGKRAAGGKRDERDAPWLVITDEE